MNAVIVELRRKQAAALDESGRVVRIPNANYEIGQTIELHEVKPVRAPTMLRRLSTGVAAAVLVAMIGTGTAYAMPYGTVTLDGDTSVAYTINCFDYVLEVQAVSEEGESLLTEMDTRQLRHHRIDTAIGTTIEQIEQRKPREEGRPQVQIQMELPSEGHSERLRQELALFMERREPQPEPTEGADFSEEPSAFPEQAGGLDTGSAYTPAPSETAWQDAGAQMQGPRDGQPPESVEEQRVGSDPFSAENNRNSPSGEREGSQRGGFAEDPGGKP